MVFLIDTNTIVRFLIEDNKEHFEKSKEFFEKIENDEIKAIILDTVICEVIYVLEKIYSIKREKILDSIQKLLLLDGIINDNKDVLINAINILKIKKIDFVDALICAKSKIYDYKIMSFDKKLLKCVNG